MSLRLNSPMPELAGATDWLVGTQPKLEELTGHPTLIYFWSATCHTCHDNMPHLIRWRKQYDPMGFKMVAIHAPRSEAETDSSVVRPKIEEYEISEPCCLDNQHKLMGAFENEFFPAYFLFDRDGTLLRRAAGNAGVARLEPVLEQLFNNPSNN
jgi:thiol-disulfide isomerase/thioredoxin